MVQLVPVVVKITCKPKQLWAHFVEIFHSDQTFYSCIVMAKNHHTHVSIASYITIGRLHLTCINKLTTQLLALQQCNIFLCVTVAQDCDGLLATNHTMGYKQPRAQLTFDYHDNHFQAQAKLQATASDQKCLWGFLDSPKV